MSLLSFSWLFDGDEPNHQNVPQIGNTQLSHKIVLYWYECVDFYVAKFVGPITAHMWRLRSCGDSVPRDLHISSHKLFQKVVSLVVCRCCVLLLIQRLATAISNSIAFINWLFESNNQLFKCVQPSDTWNNRFFEWHNRFFEFMGWLKQIY